MPEENPLLTSSTIPLYLSRFTIESWHSGIVHLQENRTMIGDSRIIIAHDKIAFRKLLKDFVEKKLGITVVAEISKGVEFLKLPDHFYSDFVFNNYFMDKYNEVIK